MVTLLDIIVLIIAAIAICLSLWALYKIYDHDALHNFITQPTVIKYPDWERITKENGIYDLKQRVKKLEADVSTLKYESAVDNMDMYDTIDVFKDMLKNKCCAPTEREMAALKLGIDELSKLYNPKGVTEVIYPKGESGESKDD